MGGGDLNLKKSWHPSTLRNIERVWKAEQKHEAEQKKIEQLQKELADERAKQEIRQFAEDQGVVKRRDDRLDWMYQGPSALVDREQYLTGRTVDKTFEILQQSEDNNGTVEQDNGTQPGAIFASGIMNTTVDMANKIREDPLFAIKKCETDQKKQLLTNPVKMKQLRELLEQSLEKKKSKKEKKRKRNEKKNNREKKEKKKKTRHSSRESSPNTGSSEKDVPIIQSEFYKNKEYGLIGGKVKSERRSRSPKRLPTYVSKFSKPPPKSYQPPEHRRSEVKVKLDPKEAQRRCEQMMEEAKKVQRDRERKMRRDQEEEEREARKAKKEVKVDFIRPMLSKAASDGTVEARIKQKMYNLQRSSGAMDRNFAKR